MEFLVYIFGRFIDAYLKNVNFPEKNQKADFEISSFVNVI
jgi:hypothetical protein